MKKLASFVVLLALATAYTLVKAQQVTLQSQTVWAIPNVSYTGTDAAVAVQQMLSATNSAGQPLVSVSGLVPGDMYIVIHLTVGPETNLTAVSISGHQ